MTARLDADLIEVGQALWVKGAPDEAVHDGLAAGGTVWRIDTNVDRTTGEIGRAFDCVRKSSSGLRWRTLTADEIDQPQESNAASIRALVRALARELGTGCACALRRTPLPNSDDARLLDAALALFRTQA